MVVRLRWLVSVLFLSGILLPALVGCADAPSAEQYRDGESAATNTSGARNATRELEDSIEKKEEVDVRLGRAVGRAGAVLTAEQTTRFVTAFNGLADVKQIEQEYQTRAANLAVELDKVKADRELIARYGGRRLLEGYELLAQTPQAPRALVFAMDVLAKRIALPGVSDGDVEQRVMGPCLAGTFLKFLIQTGDVEQAKHETITILSTGVDGALKVASWLQKYQAMTQVDPLAVNVGISTGATLEALRTIGGLIAIWRLGDDFLSGDREALARDFFKSGPNAVSGVASGVALFRRLVMGIEKTPLADAVIKWSGKIATGISVITNALALWESAGDWDDSLEDKIRVIGDVVALGASILVLVGAGPIGPVLAAVAIGISFFADWLEDRRLERQEQLDVAACLPATGLDATLIQTILSSHPALLRTLAQDVKLEPTTVQWLLTVHPQAASDASGMWIDYIGVRIVQKIWDLDPQETDAMLHAAVGNETDPDEAALRMDTFLRVVGFGSIRGDMTRAQANEWFDKYALGPEADPSRSAAIDGVQAYLATVN